MVWRTGRRRVAADLALVAGQNQPPCVSTRLLRLVRSAIATTGRRRVAADLGGRRFDQPPCVSTRLLRLVRSMIATTGRRRVAADFG